MCAKLGVTLIHARPFAPQGKGKLERWFRTVRLQLLPTLLEPDTRALEALNQRLWTWSRMTAWRNMAALIKAAGIANGPHASAKGLRHGFGVAAVSKGIALNMVQKWVKPRATHHHCCDALY